jgi:hypothetical protein
MERSFTMEINPETVNAVIDKARIFHGKEGVIIPDDNTGSSGNLASDMLTEHQDDNSVPGFKATIDDLEPDQQVELVALMWVGRGDFDASEWEDAVTQAREEWTPHTAEYLLSTPMLADYLREGLAALGYSSEH